MTRRLGRISLCVVMRLGLRRKEAEAAISKGDYIGPMHGIPVAVKDQFDTNGIKDYDGISYLC